MAHTEDRYIKKIDMPIGRAVTDVGRLGQSQGVLLRDGYSCQICGSGALLQVHHIIPLAGGGSNHTSNLITLCRSCHQAVQYGDIEKAVLVCVRNAIKECEIPEPYESTQAAPKKQVRKTTKTASGRKRGRPKKRPSLSRRMVEAKRAERKQKQGLAGTNPIIATPSPWADSLTRETYLALNRARNDQARRGAALWKKTHPLCEKCKEDCKQVAAVSIIRCPHFQLKKEASA